MLNKHNFEIAPFTGESGRSSLPLEAILVNPQETVATDGIVLVKVSASKIPAGEFPKHDGFQASDDFAPFLLPAASAKDILKLLPKKSVIPLAQCVAVDAEKTNENGRACLLVQRPDFQPLNIGKESGTFPDYQKVFPQDSPEFSLRVNAHYLKRLAQAAAAFTDTRDDAIMIHYYGGANPIRLEAERQETGQRWTALLMPLRDETAPRHTLPVAPNGQGKAFLLPAQKFGSVRVEAQSLEAAIEAYENGVDDFEWQEDPGDDPELLRPIVATLEGSDEILEELESLC